MKTFLTLCTALLILASCTNDDDQPTSPDTNAKNEIRLNDLRAGQSNRFLAFHTSCFPSGSFQYTGDTLIAEIIASEVGLAIRESYTPGSINYTGSQPVSYPVVPKEGFLLLPERSLSQLFFFFGNDTLPVEKAHTITLQQGDCYVEYQSGEAFIGEEVGFISPFEYGDIQLFGKRVVSCVPPFMGLDAYLVYDSRQLFVSMTIWPGFDLQSVNGYVMIPNE